ncbi:MAG: imidazole glycerol phosphate synthase subunit HisH [Spirochaetes bacterium]|nr:imidazole glycerol phosphate synthase subunit HisH [Spirochaetota bacterium]
MIGVIDSKICNIFSLTNMLKKLGSDYIVITKPEEFHKIDRLILPGVGAFPKAMENLKKFRLIDKIKDFSQKGSHILGICLGMQLLFEESLEFGKTTGLGLIPGKIVKISTDLVLPHMGWNDLKIIKKISVLKNVSDKSDVYFVHSYRAETDAKYIAATTEYGETIPAVVYKNNIYGTQFHPEKSQKWGEIILKNFINL